MIEARRQGSLQINDLYELPPHLESSTLTDELETQWNEEIQRNPDQPSFLRATIRTMKWRPLLFGLLLIPKVKTTCDFSISCTFSFLPKGTIEYYSTHSTRFFNGLL